jgi:hypothetical protein
MRTPPRTMPNTHPSIGNYFRLTTGKIITNNDGYKVTVIADNIVRHLLSAGKTWKEYTEELPSIGYTGGDTATLRMAAVVWPGSSPVPTSRKPMSPQCCTSTRVPSASSRRPWESPHSLVPLPSPPTWRSSSLATEDFLAR